MALFEALGPCRFAGWAKGHEVFRDPWDSGFEYRYSPGEPMGRVVKGAFVRLMATEESQVSAVYDTILYNFQGDPDDPNTPPLSYVPNVDAGVSKALLPNKSQIVVSTASAAAKDGGKETFVVFDESHLYHTAELRRMYRTVTRNMRKRKLIDGTWYFECTTMFAPGEDSMAEKTYEQAELLREGLIKVGRHRVLFDHRWGECKDPANEVELRMALREAYGDAMMWMDLDGLCDEFWDVRNEIADSRRYFLNAKTSTANSWLAEHEWTACKRPDKALQLRDLVTLGLDGSVRGPNADATALVACRVSDGHLELLALWEKPESAGDDWAVDREEVDAAVANAMRDYEVAGFFMDPALWQDYCDRWTNEYGAKMRVKASASKPLEFWCNRPVAMVAALERFHDAVLDERLSYTPAEDRTGRQAELAHALTRHVLNARRKVGRAGVEIRKETPKSKRKIDAAMSAVLAYECRNEAIAAGVKSRADELMIPRRIR